MLCRDRKPPPDSAYPQAHPDTYQKRDVAQGAPQLKILAELNPALLQGSQRELYT